MKNKIYIYYDEEGDVLEIDIGKPTVGFCKSLGKDIFEKIDGKTGDTKGFTILNFKKRTGKLKSVGISLPVKFNITA